MVSGELSFVDADNITEKLWIGAAANKVTGTVTVI